MEKDIYKTSRTLYIIEAALEYLIAISVGTLYLTKLAMHVGLSDSATGILLSFVALGTSFQCFAVLLAGQSSVKKWVFLGHVVSQLLFCSIYFIGVAPLSNASKAVGIVVFLLLAQAIHNFINSPKITWYMSLVPYEQKGRFTANKEIISLICGMLFSYGLAYFLERCEAQGDLPTAFVWIGVIILVLTVLHSATLAFSKEKIVEKPKIKIKETLKGLCKEKGLYKVIIVACGWSVASYVSTPFMGTYQLNELAFLPTTVSIISVVSSIMRILFSKTMGKLADRYSFTKMLKVCFTIEAVAFLINSFAVPANGKIVYTVFAILHAVGLAGINSATINLIYDYVSVENCMSALAIKSTVSGLVGFLSTLLMGPLVAYIQNNGNRFLGLPLYAQQVLSFFSFIVLALLLVYIRFGMEKPIHADEHTVSE